MAEEPSTAFTNMPGSHPGYTMFETGPSPKASDQNNVFSPQATGDARKNLFQGNHVSPTEAFNDPDLVKLYSRIKQSGVTDQYIHTDFFKNSNFLPTQGADALRIGATKLFPGPNFAQDSKIFARSSGLEAFLGREVECGPYAMEPNDLFRAVRMIGWYALAQNIQFADGSTVGATDQPFGNN